MIANKGNIPLILPMAHLEQKGIYLTSRLLVATTNTAYPEPGGLRCGAAYLRRRNKLIEVKWASKEHTQKLDMSHMMFRLRDPMKETGPIIDCTFDQLMEHLIVSYSVHLQKQHQVTLASFPEMELKPLVAYSLADHRPIISAIIDQLKETRADSILAAQKTFVEPQLDWFTQAGKAEDLNVIIEELLDEDLPENVYAELDYEMEQERLKTEEATAKMKDEKKRALELIKDTTAAKFRRLLKKMKAKYHELTGTNTELHNRIDIVKDAFAQYDAKFTQLSDPVRRYYLEMGTLQTAFCVSTLGQTRRMMTMFEVLDQQGLDAFYEYLDLMARLNNRAMLRGPLSTALRQLNDKIVGQDDFKSALFVEAMRTVNEVKIIPVAIAGRIITAIGRTITKLLRRAIIVTGNLINLIWTNRSSNLVKVAVGGLALLGLYYVYTSKKENKRKGRNEKAQLRLKAITTESGRDVTPLQTHAHADLPDDGHPYLHYHMCEKCSLIFEHTHKRNTEEVSKNFKHFCKKCWRKEINFVRELASRGGDGVIGMDESRFADEPPKKGEIKPEGGNLGYSINQKYLRKVKIQTHSNTTVNDEDDYDNQTEPLKLKLETQACTDPNYTPISTLIKENMVRLKVCTNVCIGGLGLKGRWLLTPAHALRQSSRKMFVIQVRQRNIWHVAQVAADKIFYFGTERIEGEMLPVDLALINLDGNNHIPEFKDITHHLASVEDHSYAINGRMTLLTNKPTTDTITEFLLTNTAYVTNYKSKDDNSDMYAIAEGYSYTAITEKGDCGGVQMAVNTAVAGKVLGIHVAGAHGMNYGVSVLVTRDMVERTMKQDLHTQGAPLLVVDDIFHHCEAVIDEASEFTQEEEFNLDVKPQGKIRILGKLKAENIPSASKVSKIRQSPIYEEIFQHLTEPAILDERDPRAKGKNIVQTGIDKFGKQLPTRPLAFRKLAKEHMKRVLHRETKDYTGPRRTLTLKEAINGIKGVDYIEPIKMNSSPGYPYVNMKPVGAKGKSWLFEEVGLNDEHQPIWMPGKRLQQDIDKILEGLDNRQLRDNFYLDWMKDERRRIAKLKKTRFFNIHNVAWLIVNKMLFGAAAAAFMSASFAVGSGLGMDMHGADPTRLIRLMKSKGTKYICTDVGEWDGSLEAGLMLDSHEIFSDWINTHEKDSMWHSRRTVAAFASIWRIHIVNNVAYQTFGGMPSGLFLTSACNSLAHKLMSYLNWLEICISVKELHPFATCVKMDEHTIEIKVGDDSLGVISDGVCEFYNDQTITDTYLKYGIQCTPPTKKEGAESPKYVTLEEAQFLKCTFKVDEKYGNMYHMAMEPYVMQELTNWIHDSGDHWELLESNLEDSMRFAYHHGRKYFDVWHNLIKTHMQNHYPERGYQPLDYDTLDHEWLVKNDMA
jgi:hypothetical protein